MPANYQIFAGAALRQEKKSANHTNYFEFHKTDYNLLNLNPVHT